MLKLRLLKIWFNTLLIIMPMTKTSCNFKLNFIRIKKQNRSHNIKSLAVNKMSLSWIFCNKASTSNDQSKIDDSLKKFNTLIWMLFKNFHEEGFKLMNKRIYFCFFIKHDLSLRKRSLFMFSHCYSMQHSWNI